MNTLNETGFAATSANYVTTPCQFIHTENTVDPSSLFELIKDSLIIEEDENYHGHPSVFEHSVGNKKD